MKSFTPTTVVAFTTFFLANNVLAANDEAVGCFTQKGPLVSEDTYTYQSVGHCRDQCTKKGKPVLGLTKGSDCFCSDKIPSASTKTSDDDCDSPCQGYPQNICGGDNAYSIYLTGLKKLDDIDQVGGKSSSTSTSESSDPPTTTVQGGQTIIITASDKSDSEESEDDDGGPNTAGIAAGVVVGVAAIVGILGGGWFFMRRRNRKAIEEQQYRAADVDNFVAGGKPHSSSSMSDSRLDPSMMAHRRQSDGSIADNQDFSRRILQVTNPDGH